MTCYCALCCRIVAAPLTLHWRWARRLSLCKLRNVGHLQRKTRNSMKQIRAPHFVWNRSCLCLSVWIPPVSVVKPDDFHLGHQYRAIFFVRPFGCLDFISTPGPDPWTDSWDLGKTSSSTSSLSWEALSEWISKFERLCLKCWCEIWPTWKRPLAVWWMAWERVQKQSVKRVFSLLVLPISGGSNPPNIKHPLEWFSREFPHNCDHLDLQLYFGGV